MVATRVLYMDERRGQEPDPCYLREFDARVVERGPDYVVLDATAFYAEGGGQPSDSGALTWPGGASTGPRPAPARAGRRRPAGTPRGPPTHPAATRNGTMETRPASRVSCVTAA